MYFFVSFENFTELIVNGPPNANGNADEETQKKVY